MRTIKMIGLDLDGTLLNREKKLTTYSKEILKEAICQGMIVLVATGRPLLGVPDFMREFPGMRYILTANGARIYDREDGNRLLYENLLSREDACTVLDVFEEYDTVSVMRTAWRWNIWNGIMKIRPCGNISGGQGNGWRMSGTK